MNNLVNFEIEDIKLEDGKDGTKIIRLLNLAEEDINIIDPIVAPTSGLRIQIYDIIEKEKYLLTKQNLFLFLRIFKAISQKFKEIKKNQNLKILIVSDNRPSKDLLLKYLHPKLAYIQFQIYVLKIS